MARPQQGQLNILGTPGASVGNLIANQAGRTGQANQVSSGMLQTAMSTASQEAQTAMRESGSTQRAGMAANTSMANARTQQEAAREGIASQEGMQTQRLEADDKQQAAQIVADQWKTQFTANVQREISARQAEHQEAVLDYQKAYDNRRFDVAAEDQAEQRAYNERVFEATTKLNHAKLEVEMGGLVMGLKILEEHMGTAAAEAKQMEVLNNMGTDYEVKAQAIRDGESVMMIDQGKVIEADPSILYSKDGAVNTLTLSGLKTVGATANESTLLSSANTAEFFAENPKNIVATFQALAGTKKTLLESRKRVEKSPDPIKKPKPYTVHGLSSLGYGSGKGAISGTRDVQMGQDDQLKAIDAQLEDVERKLLMVSSLGTSKVPMANAAEGTVGQQVMLQKGIWEGNTSGALQSFATARGISIKDQTQMTLQQWSDLGIEMMGLSPEVADRLRQGNIANMTNVSEMNRRKKEFPAGAFGIERRTF